MYIRSCEGRKITPSRYINFKNNKKNQDYYSYMAERTEDIIYASVVTGAITGAYMARKDINSQLIPKVFSNIGAITLGIFSLVSLNFFTSEK